MKIVTSIGYHDTGASIIEALLKEFDNCQGGPANYESRYLQDPDGISDLEYNLVENPHRLNSGYAVKRYWEYCKRYKRNYQAIYGKEWLDISREYVDSLIKEKYKGYWDADRTLFNLFEYYYFFGQRAIQKLLPKSLRFPINHNYMPNIDFYHVSISQKEFIELTNVYTYKLCKLLNPQNKEFVFLDQVISTNNMRRYMRYLEGVKVVLVDRDPRDIYIADAVHGHVLPKDVAQFCVVYRDYRTKRTEECKNSNVLFVMMEDLIYKYDQTVDKVIDFIGESKEQWIRKGAVFDPIASQKYTKLWEKNSGYNAEISVIEKELSEYLYHYQK